MLGLASHIYKFQGGGAVMEIAPNELDTLVGWYDFSDKSTLFQDIDSTNTPVTTGDDPIGRVYNKAHSNQGVYPAVASPHSPLNLFMAAESDGQRPIYKLSMVAGGAGSAYFDGSNDFLVSSGNASSAFEGVGVDPGTGNPADMSTAKLNPSGLGGVGGDGITIIGFIKGGQSTTSSDEYILGMTGKYGSVAACLNILRDTGGEGIEFQNLIDSGTQQTDVITGSTSISNTFKQFAIVTASGTNASKIYLDSNLAAPDQTGTVDSTEDDPGSVMTFQSDEDAMTLGIGLDEAGEDDGEEWEGRISEIIIYNRPLTSGEIEGISAYLSTKYNS
mgnify:FL=1